MPSFDVVSKVQMHEVDNAVLQTSKEVATRYDFRDTHTSIERTEEGIVLRSSSEGRVEATLSVLKEKLVRRKVSLKAIDPQKVEPVGGGAFRQLVTLNQGISTEKAKEVVKFLKGSTLKVQAAIQADQVRVTAPKKDTLQQAISAMRNHDFGIELQFENYRD
jgi:cyclic-di-GMP-binding protein